MVQGSQAQRLLDLPAIQDALHRGQMREEVLACEPAHELVRSNFKTDRWHGQPRRSGEPLVGPAQTGQTSTALSLRVASPECATLSVPSDRMNSSGEGMSRSATGDIDVSLAVEWIQDSLLSGRVRNLLTRPSERSGSVADDLPLLE